MNVWDDMPALPRCPHCGHDGEGLNWAFPDALETQHAGNFVGVQCACLNCGVHGPVRSSYESAIEAFKAGEKAA